VRIKDTFEKLWKILQRKMRTYFRKREECFVGIQKITTYQLRSILILDPCQSLTMVDNFSFNDVNDFNNSNNKILFMKGSKYINWK
jgi:hypothetical protein